MRRPTVVLFDIDGTLVLTGGAGRRAMRRAFDAEIGRSDVLDAFSFGGMTDYLIIRTALERAEVPVDTALRDRLLAKYVDFLRDELPRTTGYQVMPGVHEVVAGLAGRADYAVGLGTGNIESGARMKLEPAGLNGHFAFGGFGSDAEDRAELLRAGAERGAAALGKPLAECRIIVVGDTPRDAEAARAIGAICIGVATGGFSVEVLREAGAEYVFEDLTHPEALLAIIGELAS